MHCDENSFFHEKKYIFTGKDYCEILLEKILNTILKVQWSDWLLFNNNSAIFQLNHGERKLFFNEKMMRFALC
jgi:hypothetical protein